MENNEVIKEESKKGNKKEIFRYLCFLLFMFLLGWFISTCFGHLFFKSSGSLENSLSESSTYIQQIETARQEGWNESYIELKYSMGITKVSEAEYLKYLAAKQKYEKNKTVDNFNKLVEATQELLAIDQEDQ